tara:strand:+ start:1300 stop:1920 length:621 start_codon:yes stop_codon:yes gene_type:complete
MKRSNVKLTDMFKVPPKEPFSLKLNFNIDNPTTEKLFNKLKLLFEKGLAIQIDPAEKYPYFSLKDVHYKHIDIMKKHMLSMGIMTYYKVFDENSRDLLFKDFLYKIEKIKNLDIRITMNWKTKYIDQIMVKYTNNDKPAFEKFLKQVLIDNEVNMFFKFIKPSRLKDYKIFVKDDIKKLTYLVYFDFADTSGYNIAYDPTHSLGIM